MPANQFEGYQSRHDCIGFGATGAGDAAATLEMLESFYEVACNVLIVNTIFTYTGHSFHAVRLYLSCFALFRENRTAVDDLRENAEQVLLHEAD